VGKLRKQTNGLFSAKINKGNRGTLQLYCTASTGQTDRYTDCNSTSWLARRRNKTSLQQVMKSIPVKQTIMLRKCERCICKFSPVNISTVGGCLNIYLGADHALLTFRPLRSPLPATLISLQACGPYVQSPRLLAYRRHSAQPISWLILRKSKLMP